MLKVITECAEVLLDLPRNISHEPCLYRVSPFALVLESGNLHWRLIQHLTPTHASALATAGGHQIIQRSDQRLHSRTLKHTRHFAANRHVDTRVFAKPSAGSQWAAALGLLCQAEAMSLQTSAVRAPRH